MTGRTQAQGWVDGPTLTGKWRLRAPVRGCQTPALLNLAAQQAIGVVGNQLTGLVPMHHNADLTRKTGSYQEYIAVE